MPFKIKGREITAENPYVIAEVGSNWYSFSQAKDSITLAKNCGADAVKFQLFNHKALYGFDGESLPGEMPPDWLPKLKEKAQAVGIEFMCSAFSPQLMDEVNKYVDVHKIASTDMANLQMLDRAVKYGKPLFLSNGAWPHADVKKAANYLENKGFNDFCLMYCVSSYPSNFINPHYIKRLLNEFPNVGFSDHTTNVYPLPRMAIENGAICIEKHFNPFGVTSADSPHSLLIDDFKAMVEGIRGRITQDKKGIGENEMRMKHLVRVVAIEDIKAGDVLILDKNYGVHRSKEEDPHGAHPANVYRMEGRAMLVPKIKGRGILLSEVGL